MKWARAIAWLLLAALVFWTLENRHGLVPPTGKLLDPFSGFWRNGTQGDAPARDLLIPGLRENVRVAWDSRHVAHIFASNDHDLFFAQGYLTARDRLWQMEFQLLFAAGRLSEVVGPLAVRQDLFNRRISMVQAAENSLRAFLSDPGTRDTIEAYTAGVNAYIGRLGRKDLPLEYKILDYAPEPWTGLKCALLLKSMAYVLTAYNQDAALTRLRDALGENIADGLFPYHPPLVNPVVPPGTAWDFTPLPVPSRDSRSPVNQTIEAASAWAVGSAEPGGAGAPVLGRARRDAGSNNWAVSGRLTRSGFPILCNDMHLALALPAIWHGVQLSAPGLNVRGVTFPGAPLVVAGYNEDVAWGFTNAVDDVLDWYTVKFKDASHTEYLFDGTWRPASFREERIKVRGGRNVIDKVVCTDVGPIVRWKGEPPFAGMDVPAEAALRWLAHDPSNELRAIDGLNRAKSYEDYLEALKAWDCPAQNIVFADRHGTIAIWHQGKYPLRWKGQGRYVLDSADPADRWQGWVPQEQNPHVRNPAQGFVASANQLYADPTYPYYLGWDYTSFERADRINELLASAHDLRAEDMIRMQADVLDIRARAVLPRLLGAVANGPMTGAERRCFDELKAWDFEARAGAIAPTVFNAFWDALNVLTWNDEKKDGLTRMMRPQSEVMVDLIVNHSGSEFFDDKTTAGRETLADIAPRAFRTACAGLEKRWGAFGDRWQWGRTKDTRIAHLARIPGLGIEHLRADGESWTINAIGVDWAPSWRMVVELGPEVRAWGIYPGGQSGNPGSAYYDDLVAGWLAGKPDELVFLKSAEEAHPAVVARTTLRGAK
jgi:penicillin amidase